MPLSHVGSFNMTGPNTRVRIDDRLDTALRNADRSMGSSVVGQWRQLIDFLAQNPLRYDPAQIASGLIKARKMRDLVPVPDRVSTLEALHGRISSAPLVQLLASDTPSVAAAVILRCAERQRKAPPRPMNDYRDPIGKIKPFLSVRLSSGSSNGAAITNAAKRRNCLLSPIVPARRSQLMKSALKPMIMERSSG